MKHKKELVAQRLTLGGSPFSNFFTLVTVPVYMSGGAILTGLPINAIIEGLNGAETFFGTPSYYAILAATGFASYFGLNAYMNIEGLYGSTYDGKQIGKDEVKKYLTKKGKISLLPIVGRMIKPQDILSDDAPYRYVKYASTMDKRVELDAPVKPIDAWDKLMEKETGVKVPSAIYAMKNPGRRVVDSEYCDDWDCEEDEECMCALEYEDY